MNENCDHNLEIIDLALKAIGGIIAIVLFVIGLKRYKKEQRWKRKEFVAKEMKDFYENKHNRNAMSMLDWGSRKIELYPNHPDYEKRYVVVGRIDLARALLPHKPLTRNFTENEAVIRDTFDEFLSSLTRFHHFIETGIVTIDDFRPYLRYWIDIIANKLPLLPRDVLHHFIIKYEYNEVIKLVEKFGMKINPTQDMDSILPELEKA